jgi:hypothetical protein
MTIQEPLFFERNTTLPVEIVEGLIRERQIVAFGGPFNIGKSPLLSDLGMHILTGRSWCGRAVERRPVIHFDFETPGPVYKENVRNLAKRLEAPLPHVPAELAVFLEHDDPKETATRMLLTAIASTGRSAKLALIRGLLEAKPNAVLIIDPLELMFRIDTGKKVEVLGLYGDIRRLFVDFPHTAIIITFNLRKWDRRSLQDRPDLLESPSDWLQEICGTLDIMNRSDVRLGMDFHRGDPDARVLNGRRRGEDMDPLVVRSKPFLGKLAGYEPFKPTVAILLGALTDRQRNYWAELPDAFKFEDVADVLVPRVSLSRLVSRAKSLGALREVGMVWQKVSLSEGA